MPGERPWTMTADAARIRQQLEAEAESLIGLCKLDCVRPEGPWRSVDDLELATLKRVHWFNTHRLHSAPDYIPPVEHEQAHYRRTIPAQQPLLGQLASH